MAGQQHLDRLSAVDAGFLAQEKPNTHMHIGGLALFEGEPPALDEFLAHIESRLHLVPRYRQKLAVAAARDRPAAVGRRPDFNLAYHVRHTALPAPGDEEALLALAGAGVLPAPGPLEAAVGAVARRGPRGGGFALLSKTHHAVVDGVSGVDLASVLFDLSPEGPAERRASRGCRSRSRRAPSSPRAG